MTGVIDIQIGSQRRYDSPMGKTTEPFCWVLLPIASQLNEKSFSIDGVLDIERVLVGSIKKIKIFQQQGI